MDNNRDEIIGEGGHWSVRRIYTVIGGIKKSIIQKHVKNGNVETIDKNIESYNLILSAGLPTLSTFKKTDFNYIETEDLNPDNSDGYFVSPNTVRGCPTYSSLLLKFVELKKGKNCFIKDNEVNSELIEYLDNPAKIDADIEKIRTKRLVKGAEGKVYQKKITEIKNFKDFLIMSCDDMRKASKNGIELYFDAFFFRVKESNNHIEYKIADFDCLIYHHNDDVDERILFNRNISYLMTSLREFIEYFVITDKKNEYVNVIEEYKNNNVP